MTIQFEQFAGMQPRLDPTALADTQATLALDCRLKSTKITPIKEPLPVTAYPVNVESGLLDAKDAGTLYLWTRASGSVRNFLAWKGFVHVAPSNIKADTRHRIFVTGETGMSDDVLDSNGNVVSTSDGANPNQPVAFICSEGGQSYDRHRLFIETPGALVASSNNSSLDKSNLRYTYFYQTWVDEYGYESGAGPKSGEVIYNDGDSISIAEDAASVTVPDGVVKRRIYKVVAGNETDTIRFVWEQELTSGAKNFAAVSFTVKDEDAGEELPTPTPIPKDLDWMTAMPGNFYVGFLRSEPRRVCFSDVDLPTSWPDAYRYDIRDEAIGVAVAGNTAFVLTRGYPYAISGTAPEGMTASRIVSEQACVSARSICTMEGKVFYSSQDGVCMLSEDSLQSTVITRVY